MNEGAKVVRDFYMQMPFNLHGSPAAAAAAIRKRDPLSVYPILQDAISPGKRALDLGCGTGWAANSLYFHHRMIAHGVDFNPVVIEFAASVASILDAPTRFEIADLFTWEPERPFELVTSFGVLHHTDDCLGGLSRVLQVFLAPGGRALIGLYHKFGRAPFLKHFARLKAQGHSDDARFEAFRALFRNSADPQMQRSWFRDQVLHPFETQHTLEEVWPLVEDSGCRIIATSVDGFALQPDRDLLTRKEKDLERIGRERLEAGYYYPGFFLFYVEKPNL